jgi:hypothetical protein
LIYSTMPVAATVILIADDITIVGVLNDVGLIATVSSVAVTYILLEALDYYIIEMSKNPNNDTGTKDRSHFGAGTFAIPTNCNPQTPGQSEAGNGPGDSGDLRDNMKDSNCWCVNADVKAAAHHIIPRKAGGDLGDELRKCLKDRAIDMDSAINGVCLPMYADAETSAFMHKGSENAVHKDRI